MQSQNPRKDAGVVDRDGLEIRCTLTGTQGSNPCLSAEKEQALALALFAYWDFCNNALNDMRRCKRWLADGYFVAGYKVEAGGEGDCGGSVGLEG